MQSNFARRFAFVFSLSPEKVKLKIPKEKKKVKKSSKKKWVGNGKIRKRAQKSHFCRCRHLALSVAGNESFEEAGGQVSAWISLRDWRVKAGFGAVYRLAHSLVLRSWRNSLMIRWVCFSLRFAASDKRKHDLMVPMTGVEPVPPYED